jgi:hypothetical protein
MTLTLAKEAYDDYKRYRRDKEYNSTKYRFIRQGQLHSIASQDIQVGIEPSRLATSSKSMQKKEFLLML